MDCLSKEQMLLLQHNLTYEVYEEFMGMFMAKHDQIIKAHAKKKSTRCSTEPIHH